MSDRRASTSVPLLWTLTALFFLRVLAQALAAFAPLPFLPSMDEWTGRSPSAFSTSTSGLIPYPGLLLVQVVILGVQVLACRDFTRGHGYFVSLSARTGRLLVGLSYAYAAVMAARYVVTMAVHPEQRWLGHTVPILLHFVLAAFLYTLGRHQSARAAPPAATPHG